MTNEILEIDLDPKETSAPKPANDRTQKKEASITPKYIPVVVKTVQPEKEPEVVANDCCIEMMTSDMI
jgi:hypothetical protein